MDLGAGRIVVFVIVGIVIAIVKLAYRSAIGMFHSIVVGTDGSDTATQAVRQAIELARAVGARIELVSAYEPVSDARLREESIRRCPRTCSG